MGICLVLRVVFSYVTELATRARASRSSAGHGRPAEGRLRLLAAAERLFATRGLEVPNREIVATAEQHNQSAITYHFASRAGLIDAVCERHETPIAQHRQQLMARLPGPEDRTTRQLVEAHIQPLAAEMLRCAPSYWARLTEMLLVDEPLWFGHGERVADSELPRAHGGAPQPPAGIGGRRPGRADRRFLNSGLARWEHDSEAGVDDVAPLASFTLLLTDLAVAMLDAPASVEPLQTGGGNELATGWAVACGRSCLLCPQFRD